MYVVAKFPKVAIIWGLIIFICRSKLPTQDLISELSGFLFCGGRHLRILQRKISSRVRFAESSSLSKIFPARPTKGMPLRSSFFPGASPINITFASTPPSPGTTFVRVLQRSHL